jgi:hypothetical protein
MVARIRSYFTKVAQMLSGILAVIGALALYKGCVPIIDGWLWLGGFCFVLPLIPRRRGQIGCGQRTCYSGVR